ncbi:tetratricopeptide repeat protein [Candidatus Latescibacterota bacterium]
MSKRNKKILIIVLSVIAVLYLLLPVLPKLTITEVSINYPYDGALFPPEIAPPLFKWDDRDSGANLWQIKIEFENSDANVVAESDKMEWGPEREIWETIKKESLEKNATVTISGIQKSLIGKLISLNKTLSKNSITISTSADSVGAPIFYRDVPLPFDFAREHMERIQWRLGDISKSERPPIVLQNLPVCGNCHSFTPDGSTLAMDVDSGGDKGSYAITPIEDNIFLTRDKLITWSDYKREENEPTFGLLAQISPNGRYVLSAVKDRVIFLGRKNLAFSQLFFPVKGIIAYYDRESKQIKSLPGADDTNYVHGNPVWSTDGKYVIFARTPVSDFIRNDNTYSAVLSIEQSAKVLGGRQYLEESSGGAIFTFNLYRVPFNDGKGGKPEPLKGASHNGKSNYFAKYSHDGKWIVFCQARSFMLLQPDSKLYIMPSDFSKPPRLMNCNTSRMNSWHSWSPNSKWIVFSSKENSAYTELFLTHIDENGNDTSPVLISSFSSTDRARNIPEFVNIKPDGIKQINEAFVDYYSYARKGEKLVQFELFEEAENSFRTSIEMNPNFAKSHSNLGSLLMRQGRIDEAEEEFLTALNIEPDDEVTEYNLGIIDLGRKELNNARAHFNNSKKINSTYGSAFEGMGALLYMESKIDESKAEFLKAIENNSELADAHYQLGVIYLNEEDYDRAERSFREVLKFKDDSEAYSRLGRIYNLRREYDRAENAFMAALNINPNNLAALNDIGIIYMYKQDYLNAVRVFRQVYNVNPENPGICYLLGKALSMSNPTSQEAITLLSKAMTLMPTNMQPYLDLGNLYLNIGDKKRAIEVFERALKINPNMQEIRAQLNKIQ